MLVEQIIVLPGNPLFLLGYVSFTIGFWVVGIGIKDAL